MPTSHHRKKHKQHQQQPPPHARKRGSAVTVMAIAGGLVGFGVSYLASNASWVWITIVTAAGTAAGYLTGKAIDKSTERSK